MILKNMKYIYLFFLLLAQFGFSQTPTVEWQKCLGGTSYELAKSIQSTTDGGYIIAGSAYSANGDVVGNHGAYDAWIVKLSSNGTLEWQKALGGTSDDYANSIRQTTDGGYVVAGYTNSINGDVSGNHGSNDLWVVKLSNSGLIEWQKALGGTSSELANSIQQTADGGYIVAGYTFSSNGDVTGFHGGFVTDVWIVKISSIGVLEWQKALGGTDYDEVFSIQQTTDGGYIGAGFTGSTNGDVTGNHGNRDAWVVKLSSSGSLEWQKALGSTNNDLANSIRQTLDGGYILAGYAGANNGDVSGNHGSNDAWIAKLSSSGIVEWQKSLGGTDVDIANSIQQTMEGGYIVAGYTISINGDVSGNHGSRDAWVVKLDALSILQWQKTLGGTADDYANCIQQTADAGFIVAGLTNSIDGDITSNHGGNDAWIVKLGPDVLAISTFTAHQIKLFPNPAATVLKVHDAFNLGFDKIIVTDLTGKKVLEQEQSSNQINVENLAGGMYIIQVFSGKEMFTGKFVKE